MMDERFASDSYLQIERNSNTTPEQRRKIWTEIVEDCNVRRIRVRDCITEDIFEVLNRGVIWIYIDGDESTRFNQLEEILEEHCDELWDWIEDEEVNNYSIRIDRDNECDNDYSGKIIYDEAEGWLI